MIATGGIGRRNSISSRVDVRTAGMLPSSNPTGTATTIETPTAISHASTVATRSRRNDCVPSSSTILPATELGGGRKSASTRPSRTAPSQMRKKPASPIRLRTNGLNASGQRRRRDHHLLDVQRGVDDLELEHQVRHPLDARGVQLRLERQQRRHLRGVLV